MNSPQNKKCSGCTTKIITYFEKLSVFLYLFASFVLAVIACLLIGLSGYKIYASFMEGTQHSELLLNAVSLVIISIAIFDVGRYLIEEEVLREKELRSPAEARKTLTKFVVIIVIAISLESLVYVFTAGKKDMSLLVYPCLLFLTSSVTIISLAYFQKSSVITEEKIKDNPDK